MVYVMKIVLRKTILIFQCRLYILTRITSDKAIACFVTCIVFELRLSSQNNGKT